MKCCARMLSFILSVVILISLFGSTCYAAYEKDENVYMTEEKRRESVFMYKIKQMSEKQELKIDKIKTAYDFAGNQYTVIECAPIGYLIFCDSLGSFVEYSPSSYSPYRGVDEGLYYCGPTFYYVLNQRKSLLRHTILENEQISLEDKDNYVHSCELLYDYIKEQGNSVILDYIHYEKQTLSFAEVMASYAANTVNYGYLSNYDFFYNMTSPCGYYCPTGSDGVCGYVGLSMIIGYRDRYRDDNYMNNDYWFDPNNKNYLKNGVNSFAAYLRNNHGSSDSTYSATIKAVSESYFSGSSLTVSHTSKLWGSFTRNTIMEVIDKDNPVLLFGSLEDPSNGGRSINHAVVAYKYMDESGIFGETRYTAHFGWDNYSNIYVFGTLGSIYILD